MNWRDRYRDVDWDNYRDHYIAEQVGVSRERARQVRKILGRPCKYKGVGTRTIALIRWLGENIALSGTLTIEQVLSMSGLDVNLGSASKAMRMSGFRKFEYPNARRRFVNWDLPSSVINRVWDAGENWAAVERRKHNLSAPKWKMTIPAHRRDPKFILALSNERMAANG